MELGINIHIPGTKLHMNGRLRGSLKKPLILFVHGLTGHMDEHLFYNGARWFEKKGYSTFRFNLYDWMKGTRKMRDCTVQTHAKDLSTVIKFLNRRGASRIHVIGHSYGGPTVLTARPPVDSATLWDPTIKPTFKAFRAKRVPGGYRFPAAYDFLIGNKMFLENETLDSIRLIQNFHVPTLIICAGNGVLVKHWRKAKPKLPNTAKVVSIPGATHCFDEEGAEEKLFSQTLFWIRRH